MTDFPKRRALSGPDRLEVLLEEADHECVWCGFDLTKSQARPTRDHVVPRIKGGPTRIENELASCGSCNALRGHRAPSEFIDMCREERGLEPNVALIANRLDELSAVIDREGGMRKIRQYVTRECQRAHDRLEPRR